MASVLQSPRITAAAIPGTQSRLGEGPCWHAQEQVLYWVDIEGCALRKFDPSTGKVQVYPMPERISAVVPTAEGELLVALQNGICKYKPSTGEFRELAKPLEDASIRLNEGKCDPAGRLWVGTMALDVRPGAAALFCISPDLQVTQVLQNLTISNGLAWSAGDHTLYFIDSPTHTIQAFDFDMATGQISKSKDVVRVPEQEGMPDGMTIDANGNLWVVLHGGGAVVCYNPGSGQELQRIKVPIPNVTSCTFGGNDLDTLYITTAREWLTEEQLEQYPLSGCVFEVKLNVKGREANLFRSQGL
ncbi:SMP-30/gluconolactonase/LRE family protein [uncultured Pontibacter sp.]|uniref:SMP-30/gluconolactonase/LRE family protein n=1 Tax=uncultured Pontibacter sp. TaxID=453356 RepID=UPI002617DBD8|nr:SMP-30/gluconolactonase/LRE family protein [uncultured Pontibacter sp.]